MTKCKTPIGLPNYLKGMPDSTLLTAEEFAAILGLDKTVVYRQGTSIPDPDIRFYENYRTGAMQSRMMRNNDTGGKPRWMLGTVKAEIKRRLAEGSTDLSVGEE